MSVEVTIDGLDEWLTLCDPARAIKEIDGAVQRATEMLRDEAKQMPPVSAKTTGYGVPGIPVDTGRLRQAIAKRRLGLMASEVFVPVDYGVYVHDGHRKVPPRPFLKWLWEDFQGQEMTEIILEGAIERVLNP